MMTSGMIIKQRDIMLIPFRYSDFSQDKKRPVLILSPSTYNSIQSDILGCAITSSQPRFSDGVIITNDDMESGNLKKTSAVRHDKVYSLSKELIIHYIGKLSKSKSVAVVNKLDSLIEIVE